MRDGNRAAGLRGWPFAVIGMQAAVWAQLKNRFDIQGQN